MSAPAASTTTSSSTDATNSKAVAASTELGHVDIQTRRSKDRGSADHGWLNSYHTFSFANYNDPAFSNFHSLRVINEDRVTGGNGFAKHPHKEFEIFSYIVSGALRHQDSLGNIEIIKRGAVQFTSAGTGLSHSEYNASDKELVHFIQMWISPCQHGLKPSYATREYSDDEKRNKLRLIVSKDGRDESILIHQDVDVYASILESASSNAPASSISYQLNHGRDIYIHLIQDQSGYDTEHNHTQLTITTAAGETKLNGGDGAFLKHTKTASKKPQTFTITSTGSNGACAEFILFDLAKSD